MVDAFQLLLREDGPVLLMAVTAVLASLTVVAKVALKLATNSSSK